MTEIYPRPAPAWPSSSVGRIRVIFAEEGGFNSDLDPSFPLSLSGTNSVTWANAVIGVEVCQGTINYPLIDYAQTILVSLL